MLDVSAWSIIVPGVVTPAVVAAFAFSQQRAQRRQAAIDELRVVVDDCAVLIAETITAMEAAHIDLAAAQALHDSGRFNAVDDAFRKQREQLRLTHTRLRVRGAPKRLAFLHAQVILLFDAVHNYTTGRMRTGDYADPEAYERLTDKLRLARDAFEDEAADLVGHDLGAGWIRGRWAATRRLAGNLTGRRADAPDVRDDVTHRP